MTLGRPGALLADRYRLDRLVGGNGSGERWQAYDERLARPVTARLTLAAGDAVHEQAAQAALERLAGLNHPGVAAVYDVGTVDVDDLGGAAQVDGDADDRGGGGGGAGAVSVVRYAISEWTDGRTLSQIMATGPQPWSRVADWGRQIGGALAALHSLGIVHGALGPNSIAIHDDRQVKILDAGLGPVGDEGEPAAGLAGAPGDGDGASGESVRDGGESSGEASERDECVELPVAAADDVHTLGLLLWEAAVGAAPAFVEGVEDDQGARELDVQPLRQARVPAEMVALLVEMLDADPARRPTAAVAQLRFEPFAPTERIGDTLPELPVTTPTQGIVLVPTPQVGRTQATQGAGLGQRGATRPGVSAAALAAERERESRRRRGLVIGLALLLAAIGIGVGLLIANLKPSNAAPPVVGDTGVPSISPGAVLLPSVSHSPSPSLTSTSAAPPSSHAPSKSPSPSQSPSPSSSPSPTVSASSSATNTGSPSPSASATPTVSATDPGGGTPSASAKPGKG